jgi:hypothetical protein
MSRPGGSPGATRSPGDVLYFYLSYARLGPLPDDRQDARDASPLLSSPGAEEDLDPAVEKFFADLVQEVGLTTGGGPQSTGFYDRHFAFSSPDDPFRILAEALGRTQVFLPLYSPHYVATSWTRREQDAFRERMERQGQDAEARVLPVLWTPVPPWTVGPEDRRALDRARGLAEDVREYVKNGLRVVCLQNRFHAAYREVLERVAKEIVRIAGNPSVPPATVDLAAVSGQTSEDPSFIVTVVTAHPWSSAGPEPAWHPYRGRQTLPVADLVVRTAERHGLAPRIVGFAHIHDYSGQNPALALVDPRVLQQPGGETRLRRAFQDLPLWVRPVVVGDGAEGPLHDLADRVQAILAAAVPPSAETTHRPVERVDGPQDLDARLPRALAMARSTYLKYGTYTTAPPTPRSTRTAGVDGALSERDPDDGC